jgi:N-acetylglucosamine-6-phosphate deacetylase
MLKEESIHMKIHGKKIYMEDGVKAGVLTIEDGRISAFEENGTDPDAAEYGDLRIIPGIFDTHNHGTCGYWAGNGEKSVEENKTMLRGYLKGLASQGTVNIFPTVMEPNAIAAAAELYEEGPQDGAQILGIHSEGPWLNRTGEKGIRTPWPEVSMDTARLMVKNGRGHLKLVALAPEIPGIDPLIEYFLSEGITVAAAHSDNNYEQAMAGYAKGIRVATHTGNVMTDMHHRDVGGLGAALLNENVTCEVICDGMHICNEMLRIYFRVKSPDQFMMVSDCTPFSGAPAGRYSSVWDLEMNVTEDGFVLTDTGRLCGSSQPILYDIGNLVRNVGVPLETCLRMACLNPAKQYGFAEKKGSLAVGKDADFVVISEDYKALESWSNGRKVYDRAKEGVIFNEAFLKENTK